MSGKKTLPCKEHEHLHDNPTTLNEKLTKLYTILKKKVQDEPSHLLCRTDQSTFSPDHHSSSRSSISHQCSSSPHSFAFPHHVNTSLGESSSTSLDPSLLLCRMDSPHLEESTSISSSDESIQQANALIEQPQNTSSDHISLIANLTQERIHSLNERIHLTKENWDFHFIRQCITDRRIIQESLQEIKQLDPQAENFLKKQLSLSDTTIGKKWKPIIEQFLQSSAKRSQEAMQEVQNFADSIHQSINHSNDILPDTSWLPTSLQVATGIGIGLLTFLGISYWRREEDTTHSILDSSISSSASSSSSSFISHLRQSFHDLTHTVEGEFNCFTPLTQLQESSSQEALDYLIDLEQLLQYF